MGLWILEPNTTEDVPGTVHIQRDAERRIRHTSQLKHGTGRHADLVLAPQPSDSPNDPLNWSKTRKIFTSIFLSAGTGLMAGTHNFVNPANVTLAKIFHTKANTVSQSVSVVLLTLGVSAVLTSPAARIWGKRPVLLLSNLVAIVGYVIVAASGPNIVALFVGRGIHGLGIAGLEYLVSSSVGDLFYVHERGSHLALWHYALSGGNALGQPIGTAILSAQGWRWPFIWAVVVFAVYTIVLFFTCPETTYNRQSQLDIDIKEEIMDDSSSENYKSADAPLRSDENGRPPKGARVGERVEIPPRDLDDPEKAVGATTVDAASSIVQEAKHSYWHGLRVYNGRFSDESFWLALITPWSAFLLPAVSWAALSYGWSVAVAASFSVGLSNIFTKPPYNFTSNQVGLTVFSSFVGATLGNAIPGPISDWLVSYMSTKNNGIYEPEFRVVLSLPSLFLGLLGFWGFGWSLEARAHFMIPVFFYGLAIFAGSINSLISNTYLLDCHRAQAQDGYAAVTIFRGVSSFVMTFVINTWIERSGYKVVYFWIGAVHGLSCVIGMFLYFFGKKIRFFISRNRFIQSKLAKRKSA
ncbi:Major facilitator superfamily domain, general substrate transporter [Niveomyces insectorum RCEF 264]|uniref:Major facilitator superfamily domain, general substrate transporter n=1 Tax=Niveomyces insectorum RCEF 264 TaxID=1081102 RepID=A0A167UQX2_9HYPO|nr:Major facilitator superfamily domain, general substrate transporter [Niveomyces insectorum RCEF 264]